MVLKNVSFMSSCPLYTGKIYAIFINGENKAALYRQVICYIEVPFKAGLTVSY